MRNANAALQALWASGQFIPHLDVLIEKPTSAVASVLQSYRSFGGVNWIVGGSLSYGVDQTIASGSFQLAREASGLSLAPLMQASTLNQYGAGTYAPALDIAREIVVRVALTPKTQVVNLTSGASAGATTIAVGALTHGVPAYATLNINNGAGLVPATVTAAAAAAGATSLTVTALPSPVFAGGTVTILGTLPDAAFNPALTTYGPGNWIPLLEGVTDRIDWQGSANVVTVQYRNRLAVLADAQIFDAFEVGSDAGTPVEVVTQQIIDREAPGSFVVQTYPSSPGFSIPKGDVEPQFVSEAINALAIQYGARLEHRWSTSTNGFAATLVLPDRDVLTPLYSIGPGNYIRINELNLDKQGLRTIVRVAYVDEGTGQQEFVQLPAAEDVATDPQVLKYGPLKMQLAFGATNQINTEGEATDLATRALSDVGTPPLPHEVECMLVPWVELDDVIQFPANGVHYDQTQTGAVIGITHEWSNGGARTRIRTAEKPKGAYANWQLQSAELYGFNAAEGTDPALLNLSEFGEVSGSRTTRNVTLGWARGAMVSYVFVHDVVLPLPITVEPRTELLASAPTVLAVGMDSYTLAIPPRGFKRFVLCVPRGTDFTPGSPEHWAQDATDQPPTVEWARQVATGSEATTDVFLRASDPQGLGGAVYVWVNPTSPLSADPGASPDGFATIAATPVEVGPTTRFASGGGTAFLLNDVPVHAGNGKRVFAKFINSEGVESEVKGFDLQPAGTVTAPGGGISPGAVTTIEAFAPGVRPPVLLAALPATADGPNYPFVVLSTDPLRRLYRWNTATSQYTTAADGADLLVASVVADRMLVSQLAAIAADLGTMRGGIIVNATVSPTAAIRLSAAYPIPGTVTRYIDMEATGTQAFIQHPAFVLRANGSAAFTGDISGASGTFTGTVTVGPGTTFAANYDPSLKATPSDVATAKQQVNVSIRANTTPPTVRPDGTALVAGDLWINTGAGDKPYSWNGSAWIQAFTQIDGGTITTGTVNAARLSIGSASTFAAGYDPSTKAVASDIATAKTQVAAVMRATSAPTTRGDGTALVAGDIWINTTSGQGDRPSSWNGSAWVGTDTVITPGRISTTSLSAIVADLGTVNAGLIQNLSSNPTAVVRINSGYSLPGTAVRYLDLAASGANPFLKHERLELLGSGSGRFLGNVEVIQEDGNGVLFLKSSAEVAKLKADVSGATPLVSLTFAGTVDGVRWYRDTTNPAGPSIVMPISAGVGSHQLAFGYDGITITSSGTLNLSPSGSLSLTPPSGDAVNFAYASSATARVDSGTYLPIKVNGTTRYLKLYS